MRSPRQFHLINKRRKNWKILQKNVLKCISSWYELHFKSFNSALWYTEVYLYLYYLCIHVLSYWPWTSYQLYVFRFLYRKKTGHTTYWFIHDPNIANIKHSANNKIAIIINLAVPTLPKFQRKEQNFICFRVINKKKFNRTQNDRTYQSYLGVCFRANLIHRWNTVCQLKTIYVFLFLIFWSTGPCTWCAATSKGRRRSPG